MTDKTLPIHEFAKDGNIAAVLDELAKGTPVDSRNPANDRTPLMEAASSRHASVDLIRTLIQRGADVNGSAGGKRHGFTTAHLDRIRNLLDDAPDADSFLQNLERLKELPDGRGQEDLAVEEIALKETVLSLAVQGGELDKIETLLKSGANIHYLRPYGYDVLIDAMHGRNIAYDSQLVPILHLLIARGANFNRVSAYGESALKSASHCGRFDAIRVLLDAGADASPLEWTPFMHAIVFGYVADVERQLNDGVDLSTRDSWERTPWLLSLHVGEVSKAKLLLDAGADRQDRGRCGKPPLEYPIINGHTEMLTWLLSQGFNPDDTDDFDGTPLMEAAEAGATECVGILLGAGADIHRVQHSEPAIKRASNLEIVRLLVGAGADLNDISDEMRAALTRIPFDGKFNVSLADYLAERHPRFGTANPEKTNLSFWKSMVTSGATAYAAREHFTGAGEWEYNGPVWCFHRFGKSINELPDGRIIEIAGEHEDSYDPDFWIYNDVIVHHGDGTFDIYGYPKVCFPPTDFHTATLVGV